MAVEVLCIGHAAYDLSVFVDSFPEENSKCETQELLESAGGPAANAAYLLSMWNARSAFAGLVGDDRYGSRVRAEFQAVGTDVSLLEVRPGHPTPLSVILINRQNGSRTIVNRKIAESAMQIDAAALAGLAPRVLLFDGHELDASLAALQAFPDAISILDAGSWRHGTEQLAGRVDYLVASERFALRAAGFSQLNGDADQRTCISKMRQLFGTVVAVTLGEEGLIADDGNGFRRIPAFPAQAVDTTGAGDIFHGAFAYAVARGISFWQALRLASMAASLSVQIAGGRTSIPSLARVKEALAHAD
jgi:sulfofructose kinase